MASTYLDSPASESKSSHMSSGSARRRSPRISSSRSATMVLSADYLDRHSSKNDLVRRIRTVVDHLSEEDVECNSPDYPGLAGLAAVLVEDRYLMHRDKEVRLHTVLACMEIFYLYAPEPPWDESEILKIFPQVIRQLANLAVCTSPSQPNFAQYFRLLEQLAVVKTGVVLVEMTRLLDPKSSHKDGDDSSNNTDDNDDDDSDMVPTSEEALEVLVNLIQTLLRSVSIDHPSEVTSHATAAISACVEEFDGTVPIPVLDEILMCISAGPVIQVTNPAFIKATAALAAAKKSSKEREKKMVLAKTKLPPRTIQQTNQSYMVAASVIRRTEDRISTPTASLLNGILNGETNVIEQTNISSSEVITSSSSNTHDNQTTPQPADVWSIVYELHKITPQILTTVIGTVASSLRFPTPPKRLRVTRLLGRLFVSRTSDIAVKFHPCYREWIKRSSDNDEGIRLVMVKYLVLILGMKWQEKILCDEATDALVEVIRCDPSVEVRLAGIHQVCDLAHSQKWRGDTIDASGGRDNTASTSDNQGDGSLISARLLQAVGNRVSSKHKTERRNSVTGLAHIYYRRYILEELKAVQCGGDDCNISIIVNTIHDTCTLATSVLTKGNKVGGANLYDNYDGEQRELDTDEKYKFIPRLVFESACFTDATDPEMRNRVIQIVDDVLLGSENTNSKDQVGIIKEPLSPTSRAVGLAILVNSLHTSGKEGTIGTENNASRWMCSLLCQRAHLQHAVSSYVKARSATERCTQGSEERMAADATALEKLEVVASLSAPLSQNLTPGSSPEDLPTILKKLHTTRDKHIFRLLVSISLPSHSTQARARVFEELPKRTNRLGIATASWTKSLARRTAMGNFVNIEIITHCILLAQESFRERDFQVTMIFLNCIKMAVTIFPILGGNKECFGTLVELFSECRGSRTSELKKKIEKSGIVTQLSAILAAAASARSLKLNKALESRETNNGFDGGLDPDLQSELIRLCTKDGTSEQARHAIFTLAALTKPSVGKVDSDFIDEKQTKIFILVLKSLTSPTRLSLTENNKDGPKVICALTTLTAIAECAPSIFCVGTRGEKAIRFALNTVLLGRGYVEDEKELCNEKDEDTSIDESDPQTPCSRRRSIVNGLGKSGDKMGDIPEILPVPCLRACAAMEFLVGQIRSTIIYSNQAAHSRNKVGNKEHFSESPIKLPSSQHISSVFNVLINIIQDSGLPPSSRDRNECKGIRERAALRECAALNLLRLCDSRLKLESKYLSLKMWHILGGCLLDEEKLVRENIMNELSTMLKGAGKYRDGSLGVAPSLRFLALVTLCPDNDQNAQGNQCLNGNAANVGRHSINLKSAALSCIRSLRQTCEATSVQCRAISRKAEMHFDNNLKMKLMPEFALPFAFHILAFRPETPFTWGSLSGNGVVSVQQTTHKELNENAIDDESIKSERQHKMLQKRLRWLLEPLVQSLGESADNISFLLRQAEILGNKYQPIEVSQILCTSPPLSPLRGSQLPSALQIQNSPLKSPKSPGSFKYDELSLSKLKIICGSARQILLKFVKKDVNLTPYPGAMQIPSHLYIRNSPRFEKHHIDTEKLSGEKRKSKVDVDVTSPGAERELKKKVPAEKETKVRLFPDKTKPKQDKHEMNTSFDTCDEDIEGKSLSVGQENFFSKNEEECLSPIPHSNSPSSTPSSVITGGQDPVETKNGIVEIKEATTQENNSTNKLEVSYSSSPRKREQSTKKDKNKKSISVCVSKNHKAKAKLNVRSHIKSSGDSTVNDCFEFLDDCHNRASATNEKLKFAKKDIKKNSSKRIMTTTSKTILQENGNLKKRRSSRKHDTLQNEGDMEKEDTSQRGRQKSSRALVTSPSSGISSKSPKRRSTRSQRSGATS